MRHLFLITVFGLLAACTTPSDRVVGPNGVERNIYRIERGDKAAIQFRVLDAINALRSRSGRASVELDSQLTAAAATHSRDMSVQNRPWHFGSDGSSPLDRIARVGYLGRLVGENISESYETEAETLSAWMDQENTRNVIMSPNARKLGFAWFQERNGKIWWTLITAS